LEAIANQGWQRIVVQPHLLFQGELLDQFHAATESAVSRWSNRQWQVASHRGPSPLLVEAIVAQIGTANSFNPEPAATELVVPPSGGMTG
jgi:sirohydrochlorin ferrochelatase